MRWTAAQKRTAWIGGLALAAGGVALALAKTAQAAQTSSGGGGSPSSPGTVSPGLTPIAQLPTTGPNGCTWSTPATAPTDVYTYAGNLSNGQGPVAWTEGMSYGPVQMSDGNYWRFNMATGITNPQAPIHDVLAQVCQ